MAYFIGQIIVKDEGLWQEYVDGVRDSLTPFKARLLFRGKQSRVLAGRNRYQLAVAIEFSDQTALDRGFASASYQVLIPLRERAADVIITTYEG